MKRLLAILTSFLMICSGIIPAFAQDITFYTGSNERDFRTDLYRNGSSESYYYTVENDGYLTFTFNANDEYNSEYSYYKDCAKTFTVYQDTGSQTPIVSYTTSGKVETPKIPVAQGTKIYIRVSADIPSDSDIDSYFNFTIKKAATGGWEKELNNSQGSANWISIGSPVNGSFHSNDDRDWYAFNVPSTGYVSLTTTTSSQAAWNVSLHAEDGSTVGDFGAMSNTTSSAIPVKPGNYFVQLSGSSAGAEYALTVNYSGATGTEAEPNNSIASANEIAFYTTLHGSIFNGGDADYYKFSVAKKTNVTINFTRNGSSGGDTNGGWNVYLKNASDGNIKGCQTYWSTSMSQVVNAGTYYIFVASANPAAAPSGVTYDLTLGTAPVPITVGKVGQLKIAHGKTSIGLSLYSKTKNAKKYQVAYRKRKTVTKKKKVLKTYKQKTKKKDAKGKPIYVTKTKWVTKKYKAFKYGKWKYKTTKNAKKKIVISHLKRKTYYQVKIRGINGTFKGPCKSGFGMTTK